MKTPVYKLTTTRRGSQEPDDITADIAPYLQRLIIYDNAAGKSDALKIEIADVGKFQLPSDGAVFGISIGYKGGSPREFSDFRVDQVAHDGPPPRIQFSATGAQFATSARSPKERTHEGTKEQPLTLLKLLTRLAGDNGAQAKVIPAEFGELALPLIDQAGQSDLGLAYDVAQTYGGVLKPTNGAWIIMSYDLVRKQAPAVTITRGVDELTRWNAHFAARKLNRCVTAHYHDYGRAERIPVTVGRGEPATMLQRTYADAPLAEAKARAAYYKGERKARQLELEMPGRPDLSTHTILRMQGFRERVDTDWLITSVVHEFDAKRGYSTRVEGEGINDLETV